MMFLLFENGKIISWYCQLIGTDPITIGTMSIFLGLGGMIIAFLCITEQRDVFFWALISLIIIVFGWPVGYISFIILIFIPVKGGKDVATTFEG